MYSEIDSFNFSWGAPSDPNLNLKLQLLGFIIHILNPSLLNLTMYRYRGPVMFNSELEAILSTVEQNKTVRSTNDRYLTERGTKSKKRLD